MKITPISVLFGAALLSVPAWAQEVVPTPHFDSVELEGGGHVVVRYGDAQQVRLIQGSTRFTRFTVEEGHKLRIDACKDNCPHRYDLEVEITTPNIDALAVSGGGAIDSEGNFPAPHRLALAIDGGGKIDARAMNAEHAEAAVDGGGDIRVRAEKELTAAIDGGGMIRYWGNPRVTQAIDGGGEVRPGE
jgi:Putative auto-transporter adhesin, head GIN domain